MTRVAIRGFKDGAKVFEEIIDADTFEIKAKAEEHAAQLADAPHMIEMEFLDEPDRTQRFFRFGTDPRGMVETIAIATIDEIEGTAKRVLGIAQTVREDPRKNRPEDTGN